MRRFALKLLMTALMLQSLASAAANLKHERTLAHAPHISFLSTDPYETRVLDPTSLSLRHGIPSDTTSSLPLEQSPPDVEGFQASAKSHTYGDPPFIVKATSNSPGVITYSLISGNATVSSAGLVTLTGTGTVVIEAFQAATANYTSATATKTITVAPGAPAIVFEVPNETSMNPIYLSASSNSTGSFIYSILSGPATITGNRVAPTGDGTIVVRALEAADANYLSASKEASFTITPMVLTAKANDCSRVFGSPNPVFTGSITGSSPTDVFTESFSTTANVGSAPGAYPLLPAVYGPNLSEYTLNLVPGTVTITQASTVTTLVADSTTVSSNHPVVLTANVTSTTTGIPTGSVTFLDNGVPLQTIVVNGGNASLTTLLAPGLTHVITATSSGDANFLGSTTASGIKIIMPIQDFSFSTLGSATQTLLPGQPASYIFSVSPSAGSFDSTVTFTVTGLPNNATATFTPDTLPADAGASKVQLIIQTNLETTLRNRIPELPFRGAPLVAALFLVSITKSRRLRQKLGRGAPMLSAVLVALCGAAFLTGCGTGYVQAPKSYSLVIVAKSATFEQSQKITLNLQ